VRGGAALAAQHSHVKAYWVSLGIKTAQIAQWFGADDLDGTYKRRRFTTGGLGYAAGPGPAEIVRLIRAAGRTPVERDTLYSGLQKARRCRPYLRAAREDEMSLRLRLAAVSF